MKIVIISNLYAPYIKGGAELVAQRMAEGLRENLQHVSVITTKPFKNLKSLRVEQLAVNDVQVYRFFPINIYHYLNGYKFPWIVRLKWHFNNMFNLHSYFVIKKLLADLEPDVVITHNLMGMGFLTPKAIKKSGIRHVHVLHDVQLVEPSGIILHESVQKGSNRIIPGYSLMMKVLFKSVDTVISPSKFLLDFYQKNGLFRNTRTMVMGNPTFNIVRKEHTNDKKTLRLLYLGQLTDAKGIEGLVKTVLSMKETQIELKVVGVGPLMNKLVTKISGDRRVLLLGWQGRKGLEMIFNDSDVLVLPTLCVENSPTVVREALASGMPVLASRIGGIPEMVDNNKNGWLFNPGDWTELNQILSDLAKNQVKITSASANAKSSTSIITNEKYLDQLLTLLDTERQ